MKLKLEKVDNYDKCYCFYKILENNEKIGNIGIGFYKREDYLGIGDFEIDVDKRNQGYGTKVLNMIISRFSSQYSLICCYVDRDNINAIRLYKRFGEVLDFGGKRLHVVLMSKRFVYNYKHIHINSKQAVLAHPTINKIKYTKKGLKQ